MRKAIINQVFLYILSALLFTLILMYGLKAFNSLREKADYVKVIDFKTSLVAEINNIGLTQDKTTKTFTLPSKFTKICFIDMQLSNTCNGVGNEVFDVENNACAYLREHNKLPLAVIDAWEDNITQNVFLFPLSDIFIATNPIEVHNESGQNVGAACYKIVNGHFKLILQGLGDKTIITPARG